MAYSADRTTFGIGIRTIAWSPCGKLLAIGGGDSKLRLFNSINWEIILETDVLNHFSEKDSVLIYEEKEISIQEVF